MTAAKVFAYQVELYLGAVLGWVDITADVQGDVTITRGQTGEGYRAERGRCTLRLDNLSRKYSPRDAAGSWYGLLGRNTPLRVKAGRLSGALVARFAGEVPAWPPSWNANGTVRYVDVEAVGVLQRSGQGEQPKDSAMRRAYRASGPVAYWPMEDGATASQVGSEISGHPPLLVSGPAPEFVAVADYSWGSLASQTVRYGTGQVVDLKGGASLSAAVPADVTAATAAAWTVVVNALTDYNTVPGDVVLVDVATPGGTFVRWQLVQTESPYFGIQLFAYDAAGARTTVLQNLGLQDGFVQHELSVWQDGATIRASYVTIVTGSVAGTLAGIASVGVNTGGQTSTGTMPFGHLAVWASTGTPAAVQYTSTDAYGVLVYGAGLSYWREASTDRLARLSAEQGIPFSMPAVPVEAVQRMGWQAAGTFRELLDEAIEVDGGYLYEDRTVLGLAYRPRDSLYNQTPVPIVYTGQLALTPPFAPVDDLDAVRNDVTVKRTDGSQVRLVQSDGPLAAVPPPTGVGVYQTAPELNLLGDDQLGDQAGWRLHLGTVDRPRYPSLGVQLAAPAWQAAPAALDALLAVDTGDVLEVTGLPVWAAGDVRTLVTGYTETISEFLWSIAFTGVPALPYDVATADGDARVPMDGGTLAAAVTAGGLSLSLASTAANGLWTTDAADFPLDLRVGEERVTVSAIAGTVSPQTATVTARAVNGVSAAWPSGTEVDVWRPAVAAL
ncbi:hypothetical protein [Micromonospora sp. C41]|uniref:hypothetical protein n=1 Tax=Micromonospora sp. C41 TaxID=2824878 RepID=UPI001B3832DE|nr:hypothetical protein [Micromonospora sp. C41]MBQ1061332.1 hypothetical protein [Micromonospora sp. C41]